MNYFERRMQRYREDLEELRNQLTEDLENAEETNPGSETQLALPSGPSGGEAPPTILTIPDSEATKDSKKKRVV